MQSTLAFKELTGKGFVFTKRMPDFDEMKTAQDFLCINDRYF